MIIPPKQGPWPPVTRRRRAVRGVALLVVLMTVTLTAVLVTMQLSAARAATTSARINAWRSEARFLAESGANDALWLGLSQRLANPADPGGQGQTGTEGDDDEPIWIPDGRLYRLLGPDHSLDIRIFDANRGYDLTGANPGARLRAQAMQQAGPDGKLDPELETFFDRLNDYVDNDDLARLFGRERLGYAEVGLPNWPRNAPLQYREEAWWLAGVTTFLGLGGGGEPGLEGETLLRPPPPDAFRIIPPTGTRFAGRPSFLSSSPEMLMQVGRLTSDELRIALTAREAWYRDRQPLTQGLGELYGKLAGLFSMTPGAIYTIEVRATVHPSEVSRRVVLTLNAQQPFIGGRPGFVSLWEKRVH